MSELLTVGNLASTHDLIAGEITTSVHLQEFTRHKNENSGRSL